MSATGRNKRGRERDPHDYYATPSWCVDRLLEARPPLRQAPRVLEPCAGDGAILRALRTLGLGAHQTAWEIQARFRRTLAAVADAVRIGDALDLARRWAFKKRWDVVITNPPYALAMPLLRRSLDVAREVFFLLRVSFLESAERHYFLSTHAPDVYVLPDRPNFAHGNSDNSAYAWMRFTPETRRVGTFRVLDLTSQRRRAREKAEACA